MEEYLLVVLLLQGKHKRKISAENIFLKSKSFISFSGLHAEIQNVYLLYIRVLVNPPLIGSITIRLKDENDEIPIFDIRSIVLSVIEKEYGNRTIAQIQAFDRDVDYQNSYVQYRLNTRLSDTDAIGKFHVESDGTVWTNTVFGKEANKTFYRLFITAYDNAPAWNSPLQNTQDFQFDVQVISMNDKSPGSFLLNKKNEYKSKE